ncbi:MAG: methyltransferase domain-containing protein [Candidatus Eisenbacteria bacterium]|nr:methyltransferase domain-containing protein [Candidatus Eisenbacteria bacterium]
MRRSPGERARLEPMRHRADHGGLREHLARYRFCAERVRGRVLDAGCGSGYGTHLLASARAAGEVVGLDRSADAVAYAAAHYAGPGVRFARADLLSGALAGWGQFNTIVCLEVLEHLPAPERLLSGLDGALRPGGRLIVSTPLGRGRAVASGQPDHCFQLRRDEFERMLHARFVFRLFGQKGETIERWRPGHRYFLMLALCRSRWERDGDA